MERNLLAILLSRLIIKLHVRPRAQGGAARWTADEVVFTGFTVGLFHVLPCDNMLDNSNPQVFRKKGAREFTLLEMADEITAPEPVDSREIFDLIRDIRDPEHPLTLEELNVVCEEDIEVNNDKSVVLVKFTPTINHCSLATLIGLSIQVKLLRCLPSRFKIDVRIAEGTHATEESVNKQLADKERVAAALENPNLLEAVNQCIAES